MSKNDPGPPIGDGTLISKNPDRPEWLIRPHVGLESKKDLIADLKQALED